MKPKLFIMSLRTLHLKCDVTYHYYTKLKPKHKKSTKFVSRIPNANTKIYNGRKIRLLAALVLGLGILD